VLDEKDYEALPEATLTVHRRYEDYKDARDPVVRQKLAEAHAIIEVDGKPVARIKSGLTPREMMEFLLEYCGERNRD